MPNPDFGIINTNGKDDELPLQYLGAAALLRWAELPEKERSAIYDLASTGKIVGLSPTVQLKQQIDSLLRRNGAE